MSDPILHILAWVVLVIDLAMIAGALMLSYVLIRYREAISLWYQHIRFTDQWIKERH